MSSHLLHAKLRRHNGDDNLIPLINIVFLLLVFFMVAGTISATTVSAIDVPASASNRALPPTTTLISIDRHGALSLNGVVCSAVALPALLQKTAVAGEYAGIVLRADRNTRAADLDRVLTVLRALGISQSTLQSTPADAAP